MQIDPFPQFQLDILQVLCFKSVDRSLSCPPCEKLLQVHHVDHGVHKIYPCLKLTEKLYTLVLNQNFLLIFVLFDEHDGTFCISMTSDKPASSKKMARELPLLRPASHRRLCVLKSQRVLADLCNHTGLEVSFHQVETCKSMSHRVFSFFYPG